MLPILGSTKQDLTFYESHALNITDHEYYIFDHIELPRTVRKWGIASIYMKSPTVTLVSYQFNSNLFFSLE